jgi:hypothetical protein
MLGNGFVQKQQTKPNTEDDITIKSASLFSQLLEQIPCAEFARIVERYQGERHARGFTCWTQFVRMLFCQLAQADSLREICNGIACCLGKLEHVGLKTAPNKSTLSYVNQHRSAEIYEALFWNLMERLRSNGQLGGCQHKFRFKNKLLSLDSATISLCLPVFS